MTSVHTKCLICGEEVCRGDVPIKARCDICGEEFVSYNYCRNGHHVCVECIGERLFPTLLNYYLETKSTNPVEIAEHVMNMPGFTLVGCKHYFVAALSLCAAYRNAGGVVADYTEIINLIIDRVKMLPDSMCRTGGVCGVPLAIGIAIQVMGLTSKDVEARNKRSSELAGFCITKMFDEKYTGSTDCCKRNLYLCLQAAAVFIRNYYWVDLTLPEKIACPYAEENPRCNGSFCLYYDGKTLDYV